MNRHLTLTSSKTDKPDVSLQTPSPLEAPSLSEILDVALLDKLLETQEKKAEAKAYAEQNSYALQVATIQRNRAEKELHVERSEREAALEKYREQKFALRLADAKIVELKEKLYKERHLANVERQERQKATEKRLEAETETVKAVAAMGWLARRRFRSAKAR